MNHTEQEKQKTAERLEDFFIKYDIDLASFVGIQKDRVSLKNTNDLIKEKSPLQITVKTGSTLHKRITHNELINILMSNIGPAISYFDSVGDVINLNKINIKEYIIRRYVPADLNSFVDIVVKILTDNQLVLVPYGVTTITIGRITTAQTAYNLESNLPEELITESSENTKLIKQLFRLLTRIMNIRLKNSMLLVRETKPEIYNLFLAITHNLIIGAHSHRDPSVVVGTVILEITNINTLEPAPGVCAKAVGFVDIVLSDENGMLEMELPIGIHIIKFISYDFVATEVTVTVTVDEQIVYVKVTPIV